MLSNGGRIFAKHCALIVLNFPLQKKELLNLDI